MRNGEWTASPVSAAEQYENIFHCWWLLYTGLTVCTQFCLRDLHVCSDTGAVSVTWRFSVNLSLTTAILGVSVYWMKILILCVNREQILLFIAITHVTYARLFRINFEFDVDLDLYCSWYFSYCPCKHRVTWDVHMEDPFSHILNVIIYV
jgi:hypothetical protein